ncbi:MAG: Ig-like domain-containing protein, partial [Pseudomonadales bacterium]
TLDSAGTTASFVPDAPLEHSTTYTATISGATSQASGLALEEPFTWSFRTIAPPPTVTAVAPINRATGVPVNNTVITAQFSEPVAALADSDFTVNCEAPCTNAVGTVSMNTAQTIATFNVSAPGALEASTEYTATIVTATSVANGQEMHAPFVWRFTTGLAPDTTKPRVILTEPPTSDPGPTVGVPTNTAITATFSEDMDPLTITDTTYTLTCAAPCVSPLGAVTYVVGSRTAVFTPENELESGTTYTATVESDVTDLAGNRLAGNQGPITDPSDYIWTFTTDVALPENNISVLSTNPGDGGTLSTCPTSGINATFDVPSGLRLDPATVTSLTFQVVEDATPLNIVIAESVVLDVDTGTIVTFTPQADLTDGVTYRATLKGGSDGVKDLAVPGNEMLEDFVWTFTAVAPVEPCFEPFPLNAATPFGGFGGSAGMTNEGLLTIINGDIGTTGASTLVTGFVGDPE